jgi:hypothetical protein
VGDMFIWMPKEHLYVLVYLVTVMHSMQAGYMDKAQKYTDKALMQIEKLKSMWVCSVPPPFPNKGLVFIPGSHKMFKSQEDQISEV